MNRFVNFLKSKMLWLGIFMAAMITPVVYSSFVISTNTNLEPNFTTVAYNNTQGDKPYPTIEKALKESQGGDIITVVPGTNPIISQDCSIPKGVSLHIPYALQPNSKSPVISSDKALNNNRGHAIDVINDPYLKSTVTLAPNVTLQNNGKLFIGGILSGGGGGHPACGQTGGDYAKIVLKNNAVIRCGNESHSDKGFIYCHGYIVEDVVNNDSLVDLVYGDLYQPFVVNDFRGGSNSTIFAVHMGAKHASPFNQYEMINVQSKIRIRFNSRIFAYCNISAGGQQNNTVGNLIGDDASFLIHMKSPYTYIEAKMGKEAKDNADTYEKKVTVLDIYGNAQMNALGLSAGGFELSTDKVYFPITWKHRFYLHSAGDKAQYKGTFNVPYDLKMLPGSFIQIDAGSTLSVNNLHVMDYVSKNSSSTPGFDDSVSTGYSGTPYVDANNPLTTRNSKLIINGAFIAKTKLGGFIQTKSKVGILDIRGKNSITTSEGADSKGVLGFGGFNDTTQDAQGYTSQSNATSQTRSTLTSGSYLAKGNYWSNTFATINKINYVTRYDDNTTPEFVTGYGPASIKSNENLSITNPNDTPTHNFVGWYLGCFNRSSNNDPTQNIYINKITDGLLHGSDAYQWATKTIDSNGNENYELTIYARYTKGQKITVKYINPAETTKSSGATNDISGFEGVEIILPFGNDLKFNDVAATAPQGEAPQVKQYFFDSWSLIETNSSTALPIQGFERLPSEFTLPEHSSTQILYYRPKLTFVFAYKVHIKENHWSGQSGVKAKISVNGESAEIPFGGDITKYVPELAIIQMTLPKKGFPDYMNYYCTITDIFGNPVEDYDKSTSTNSVILTGFRNSEAEDVSKKTMMTKKGLDIKITK